MLGRGVSRGDWKGTDTDAGRLRCEPSGDARGTDREEEMRGKDPKTVQTPPEQCGEGKGHGFMNQKTT